jgi:caa(3)-type oxidase subunit IV
MANPAESHGHDAGAGHGAGHGHEDHTKHYLKIYWMLLALFAVSVTGPMIGIKWLTLLTAFGIAVVKAYLVAANFMHLNVEKKYVAYLLCTALAFMFLFYAGVAPDVMNHRGRRWENTAAMNETKRALKAHAAGGGHGEHGAEQQPAPQH